MQVINFIFGMFCRDKTIGPGACLCACLCVCIALLPVNAWSQQNCNVIPDAIIKLHAPEIGAYSVWNSVHGDYKHRDRYVSGAYSSQGDFFVVGERSLDADIDGQHNADTDIQLLFVQLDYRGRVSSERAHPVKGLEQVLKVFPAKVAGSDSFVVLAKIREKGTGPGAGRHALWLGFIAEDGTLKGQHVIRHDDGDFVSADVVPVYGGGYVMVAGVVVQRGEQQVQPDFSVFYRLNPQGRILSERSYKVGLDNKMASLVPIKGLDDSWNYIVAGTIKNAQGHKAGWLLRLDSTGNFMWQRQFSRGVGAELMKAFVSQDGRVFAVGRARPTTGDSLQAGWVLQVEDSRGDIVWQRYLTGYAHYNVQDIVSDNDGVISVLLNAKPVRMGQGAQDNGDDEGPRTTEAGIMGTRGLDPGEKYEEHALLVTLGPRGSLFDNAVYFNGEGAYGYQLIEGPRRERIIVGYTQAYYRFEEPVLLEEHSDEGWIVATTPMSAFEDPCKSAGERDLDAMRGFE